MEGQHFTEKICSAAGVELASLRFRCPSGKARAEIIICHGFQGSKENHGRIYVFAEKLNEIGFNVTAFDFTGAGSSGGNFSGISLSRQAADLQSVIEHVHSRNPVEIILLGRSFGGSTALAAGFQDLRVKGFIFWSTPVRLHRTFSKFIHPIDSLENGNMLVIMDDEGQCQIDSILFKDFACHDMEHYGRSLAGRPSLVVHGTQDQVVEPSEALYLAELAGSSLHMITGADHQFTSHCETREEVTIAWLKEKWLIEGGK